MASQIAHIVYAKKYFEKYPSTINKDEFLLGCVFPDIRRIDENISRKDTHLCFDPIDLDFSGLTAFQAGWKFHLYCDMKREEILNKHDFYSFKNTSDFWHFPTKILEDEIVYDVYNNWEKLALYFNNVPTVGSGPDIPRETFEHWYAIIARYMERKPDDRSMHIFLSKQPTLAPKADGMIKTIRELRKNKKVMEILGKVYQEIM